MNMKNYKQVAAITIILLLGLLLAWSLSGFFNAFLSAVILYVLSRPLMRYLIEKRKWKRSFAAFFIMFLTFVTILLPVWGLYQLLSSKIMYAINHGGEMIAAIQQADLFIESKTGFRFMSADTLKKLQESLATVIPGVLGATAGVFANIAMMYFILYYMFVNVGALELMLAGVLPVSDKNTKRFADELASMVNSNVLGAPVLAIVQGAAAGLLYWGFGLDEPWFWGIITGFFSFIPLVGTSMIWIPAGVYMLINGETWQGAGIIICGSLIITNIDNVFRFWLQKKFADIHPMVTVLGVITGINWFGLPGVVFGPLLISYFLLMVKMYKEEFTTDKKLETVSN